MIAMSDAERDVLLERRRQISQEGWTPEHDDKHTTGEIALAAACYAAGKPVFLEQRCFSGRAITHTVYVDAWPWSACWWKPKDRRGDLVRAAALVIAEIDRLDRLAAKDNGLVAQGTEHRDSNSGVAGSNPAEVATSSKLASAFDVAQQAMAALRSALRQGGQYLGAKRVEEIAEDIRQMKKSTTGAV